jgi:hypothetical protein
MSGGGIWRIDVDASRRLVGDASLVGIGFEFYRRQRAFVATRVASAIPLANDLSHHLGSKASNTG